MTAAIVRRLRAAEAKLAMHTDKPLRVENFYIEGNGPGIDPADFLRSQGHDFGPDVFAVIRTIIDAKDGKAVEAPFVDVTHEMSDWIGRDETQATKGCT
jgi:hypothetical protein